MPEIRILIPGDEPSLEAFLLPRIDSSMFLIGNSRTAGLVDQGQPYEGTYAAAFEGKDVIGVVAHYWNQNLIFQAPVYLLENLCSAAVHASRRPVRGLLGPAAQVGVAKKLMAVANTNTQLDEKARLYSLHLDELLEPEALRSGAVRGRRVEPADLEVVAAWRVAFSVEALGEKETSELRERSRAETIRSMRDGRIWLLEDGDRLVACTGFNIAFGEAVQVGGVWTPPALRGRGYGRCVVAASLLDARREGVEKAILFTAENNVAAQRAYEALGFRRIGDYRILFLNKPRRVFA